MGTDRVLAIIERHGDRSESVLATASTELDHLDADELMVVVDHDDQHTLARLRQLAVSEPRLRIRTVAPEVGERDRLEVGLFDRPLPDRLLVLGRGVHAWDEVKFLSMVLHRHPSAAGIISAARPGTADARTLLTHGGVFMASALCAAGGFASDDARALRTRLNEAGHGLVTLTAPRNGRPALRASQRAERELVQA